MAYKSLIGESMTKHPYIANRKMTVKEAGLFMEGCRIRHLPVIENSKIVGIVSDRDLQKAGSFRGPGELLVEDVMTRQPYCVKKGANIAGVVRAMAHERIGSAIVLDEQDQIIGIFTTTDGMLLLSEILEKGPQSQEHRELPWESFPEYMSW
ncbi:MAG: hypothetical protein A4S09_05415 [Proteobacteria bacterium SG_bin7]|nr:MAG: hypothetical protein A4S09_05415 [Proteobacteria bacterium SG_bin7]